MIEQIKKELNSLADKKQAKILQGFFKTGPGQYGEGDVFLGIKVPVLRIVAAKYNRLSSTETEALLHSEFHEYRMAALIILVNRFRSGNESLRTKIYGVYLKNTKWINNWDLVDLSAHQIVGAYLIDKPRVILYRLARSEMLWERRIAIVSTFAFIRANSFHDTIAIAEILLDDKEDLMHKAAGWMLRETGKKSADGEKELIKFLDTHAQNMPRTCLRYAIERLDDKTRAFYLRKGKSGK